MDNINLRSHNFNLRSHYTWLPEPLLLLSSHLPNKKYITWVIYQINSDWNDLTILLQLFLFFRKVGMNVFSYFIRPYSALTLFIRLILFLGCLLWFFGNNRKPSEFLRVIWFALILNNLLLGGIQALNFISMKRQGLSLPSHRVLPLSWSLLEYLSNYTCLQGTGETTYPPL